MHRKRGDFICGRADQKNALNVMHKALSPEHRELFAFALGWSGAGLDVSALALLLTLLPPS